MTDQSPFTFIPRSPSRHFDPKHPETWVDAVRQDMRNIGKAVGSAPIYLSGKRVIVPLQGLSQITANVYAVTDTATVSSGGNYHTLAALRSGNAGQPISSLAAEFPAYSPMWLGAFPVGFGDLLSLSLTVTGSPSPVLTLENFTVLAILTGGT